MQKHKLAQTNQMVSEKIQEKLGIHTHYHLYWWLHLCPLNFT